MKLARIINYKDQERIIPIIEQIDDDIILNLSWFKNYKYDQMEFIRNLNGNRCKIFIGNSIKNCVVYIKFIDIKNKNIIILCKECK